ncbi:N-carbamoyl-L-amino-acid hydrolase [Rhodoferax ferrireducens]|uniref:N-carbamoyl-L-amino-acid hydrolase n=1 Tax=Rhodoferax ferrireducens TaxID=192843 RepID=A0ABU2CD45_9BURK|nr:hydantoinase/carbamoylase family amidase [Rhodoferax ferrireducens]MDR7379261.1 N-carbamoyl-L-amino-acid hydrolase [Rhodoferax ferrireducens]
MTPTLEYLNHAPLAEAAKLLEGLYADSPWVAQQALNARPYASLAHLKHALARLVASAERNAQLPLVHAAAVSPGNAVRPTPSSSPSAYRPSPLSLLITAYQDRFGFPPVLAACGPRGLGLSQVDINATLQRRLDNHPEFEWAECLRNVHRMVDMELNRRFDTEPAQGNEVWDWSERLAIHSDPGYAERGELTVTYLTDAHRAVAQRLSHWMRADCGFDEVEIDAVGNVVGIYHGSDRNAPRLLTGSHYDTVRNGGKYDGRLGILVPMACVRQLHAQGRRLPFGFEVVGFAEEEGQRYKAVFLGSGALTGQFDMGWLEQKDADGITMREAMVHAGLCIDDIGKLQRDASRYLGFVEVHIEQGPVLNEIDVPLGIVTSINGSLRYVGEIVGTASHAGTTPMDRRRDAATAAAELALYVEKRGSSQPHLVATVGMLEVPNGSINVVPGRCKFSLDIRATTNAVRDACAADVRAELAQICQRRGLQFKLEETMCAAAAPSAPAWQQRWEKAVETLGVPLYRMPSGAGHDAMKLHEIMPQAMLFVRGENAGISHNPLESTTSDDMQLAVEAFSALLDQLAATV